MNLQKTVEAVLFASGKELTTEHIARLCKQPVEDVQVALEKIRQDLEAEDGSTMLVYEAGHWKLTVREKYLSVVRKIVTKTDLPKTVLETLAVISYKAPVLQSDVIKIRTNKAYDHLRFLEEREFITREKKGRTKLIKITQKFFDYFDLPPEKLKEKFKNLQQVEQAIEEKEKEHQEIEERAKQQAEEQLAKPEIDLETYGGARPIEDEGFSGGVEIVEEKVGELDVYEQEAEKPEVKEKKPVEERPSEEVSEEKVAEEVEKVEGEKEESVEESVKPEAEPEKTEEEPAEEKKPEEKEKPAEETEERLTSSKILEESKEHASKLETKEFSTEGLYPKGMPPDIEEKVDEKVKKILEGEEEE